MEKPERTFWSTQCVFNVHPCGSMCEYSIQFYSRVWVTLYFICPYISWWVCMVFQLSVLPWTFVYVFAWTYAFISPGCIPRSGTAGHTVMLCLTFWETAKLFSRKTASLYVSISSVCNPTFYVAVILRFLPGVLVRSRGKTACFQYSVSMEWISLLDYLVFCLALFTLPLAPESVSGPE